jgi:3'(2'), 5'-bisphosphate nucleotidase
MLASVTAIARRAGEEILVIYKGELTAIAKADGSPLTAADQASNDTILAGLASLTPGVPVLSEESAGVPWRERCGWTRYWLVDPLDGTKEFLKRNGDFTVNIALIEAGRPTLAVVHAPARGITYFAAAGAGAFRQDGGTPARRIRARRPRSEPPRVVASRSHRGELLDAWLQRLGAHEVVSVGSSLKFCMVAEGLADLYPRLGPTMEWDTAAGQCVAECAGASVLDAEGAPLACNRGESLVNPHFIVNGDPTTTVAIFGEQKSALQDPA